MSEQQPTPPPFDPSAEHHVRPKLRPVRGFPAQVAEGQVALGLADARQISDRMVLTSPAVQNILPHMNGEKSISDIVAEVGSGLTEEILQQLVAQLDDAGLLFGPRFDALLAKMHEDFDAEATLPPGATAAFADALVAESLPEDASDEERQEKGTEAFVKTMDAWIDEALTDAEQPSFDTLPKAIVVPHVDYARGARNYAAAWGRLRVVDRPDRVVILGTNHFGFGTGVTACDKGFESPLGTCPVDSELVESLRSSLGESLFANRYDHEREHSIELHIPWLQHCLGASEDGTYPKVFAALVHDPAMNDGESYDGQGIGLLPFVEALKAALSSLGGKTLIVSSADLSHVGPAFGDQQSLVGEEEEVKAFRDKVFQHDREMIDLIAQGKAEELVSSMAWQQNPTRWCSIGNLVAMMKTVDAEQVEILGYLAAADPQGQSMVSSVAGVVHAS